MMSNCKRNKVVRIIEEDRLSYLPNVIICHILSFLPTDDVVRTTVLSTMWKDLFLDVPNIKISKYLKSTKGFIDFVNEKILSCKTNPLTEFKLECQFEPNFCVHLSLADLIISQFSSTDQLPPRSPPDLCSPNPIGTLVILKLSGDSFILNIPEKIRFPNLKVLDLESIKIDADSDNVMIDQWYYPLLEELRLKRVLSVRSRASLSICLSTLRNLVISAFGFEVIRVDSPKLQHLEFIKTDYNLKVDFCKSESLVSAHVNLSPSQSNSDFFRRINNVQKLFLSRYRPWESSGSFPCFANLIHLDLASTRDKIIWSLLGEAPNLEELVYDLELPVFSASYNFPPANGTLCTAESLREIKIRYFGFLDHEIKTLGHLLQHGKVVKRVIVELESNMNSQKWLALHHLQKLRSSQNLTFVLQKRKRPRDS